MPDLIDDGTWREAALARMIEVFPTNRGLWPMYMLMAGATLTISVTGIGQRSRYQVSQLVGARNSRPAPEVLKVVGTFVEEINNRARVATTVGAIE